ncbi:DUF4222 domain-containing protein [Escherichia coli]|nr:DUF4222 domain-containing protein [Escherichia coli]EHR9096872.1 DUF4222 domain-containing protein [Escherichia coli]EIM2919128.1 DUF4222 domain-containing protein [Escherichia coli]EIM2934355.1 DUF4222 domain-containing protein [Escherichia coli]EIM2938993.1 DUF4222 domain-containing protein [Escherichia coli]
MFSLIQRGQIYTDGAGWPVKICHCTDNTVFYRHADGNIRKTGINTFNQWFEPVDRREYHQILAETERETHLKKLRTMQKRR